jgi:aryl-alcohol dehydrogenase-like predicted oxidoreductase
MKLTDYITLGRSGLAVSPLALGAMTFGPSPGMGIDADISIRLIADYLDRGGNFIDTADGYGGGESERIIGKAMMEGGSRDRVVLATKFTMGPGTPNPNASGNGRKNAYRALEGSLQRLGTDYVDLYWLHTWDTFTPVEEVVQTFDAMIREGKIRYYGLSDVPAWYATRAVSVAERYGLAAPIALQLEYSLIDRSIEREHLPAALELGLGLCPFSPLGGGALTGKYRRDGKNEGGRLTTGAFGGTARLERRGVWETIEVLKQVADEIGKTSAQVALNWACTQYVSTSVLVGATRPDQLTDNLAAIDFDLSADQRARLDAVSRPEVINPYHFFGPPLRDMLFGASVKGWRARA